MIEPEQASASEALEYELIALTHRLRRLRPALSPSMDGLTTMEIHALMVLFRADEDQCSVKPSDIARQFRVSPSAVSQFLKSLEQKGFIVRVRAEGDSRSVHVCLTEKGQALSDQLRRERAARFSTMVENVGVENMEQFASTLRSICEYAENSDTFVSMPHECGASGRGMPCI